MTKIVTNLAEASSTVVNSSLFRGERHDRALRELNKIKAVKYLGGYCANCGNFYHHSAMEFHHKRGAPKRCNVSQLLLSEWSTIKAELDKCELVCSNCHATEHWLRNHPNEAPLYGKREPEELGYDPQS